MTRVVFFGTPGEALPTLEALYGGTDVALVVTQPDRPKGRSGRPQPPPVKVFARDRGIPVVQPQGSAEIAGLIGDYQPLALGVVVAFGQILRPEVLEIPPSGLLNVHFSLLPRWRGAAPVSRALMAGDTMTGVTIIRLDEGLDTGAVLTAQAVDILPDENAGSLTDRLAHLGARLLMDTLPAYLSREVEPVRQVEEGALYAPKISSEDRLLKLDSAVSFINHVRGLAPLPGATLEIDDQPHKILAAKPHPHRPPAGEWASVEGVPVVSVGGEGVEIVLLQAPGRKAMSGADWLRGIHRDRGRVS